MSMERYRERDRRKAASNDGRSVLKVIEPCMGGCLANTNDPGFRTSVIRAAARHHAKKCACYEEKP